MSTFTTFYTHLKIKSLNSNGRQNNNANHFFSRTDRNDNDSTIETLAHVLGQAQQCGGVKLGNVIQNPLILWYLDLLWLSNHFVYNQ